jgi:predicted HicB family RNase H-like nuclease
VSRHDRTLRAIFADPVRAGIHWSDIVSLLEHLGAEVTQGEGSRVRVALRSVRAVFHRPHPRKETDKGAVRSFGAKIPHRSRSAAMMRYKGYVGKVEFDAEAGILHGEVVGIRDVVTFQGVSVREVERAFRESVDDYLAFCRERGEDPDKPCSGRFVARVGSDLHRRLEMLARASGKSLNALAKEFLECEVDAALPADRPKWRTPARKRSRSRRPQAPRVP